MKACILFISFVALSFTTWAGNLSNPLIDVEGHKTATVEALKLLESHRLTVEKFIEYATTPGTVVLDTRSKHKFELIHAKRATNLNFSDFTEGTLGEVIPDKNHKGVDLLQ